MSLGQLGWCKACGAPLLWSETRNGKPMPLDREPTKGGNIRLLADGTSVVLAKPELGVIRATGEALYLSHFATCPEAPRFRRGRG